MLSENETKRFVQERLGKEKLEHAERVAQIIKDKELSLDTYYAALLHDTLFTGKTSYEELEEKFSKNIAELTKEVALIEFVMARNYSKVPAETLADLILSITNSLEPVIIMIADVSDILSTNTTTSTPNLVNMADEILVPLAVKLGISGVDWKLQDQVFRTKNPEGYSKIKKMINKTREEREELINVIKKEIEQMVKGKITAQVYGRPKNFKAIYEKLKRTSFNKMYDLYGIRIICNKEKDCYEALGYVHSKYEIIKEAFDDYITKPKNGYKGIHTAIIRGNDIIEVQIRTWDQHLRIESSLYWEYKRLKKFKENDKAISWERQLIEWQKNLGTEHKRKSSGKRIFTFTPRNDVIVLPAEATIIDFAFAVHTDIGKRILKAKVNDKLVPIETKLKNLDRVEIILGDKPTVNKTWLTSAISDKAKHKIKQYFGITSTKPKDVQKQQTNFKKIKMADCCHPLPGEDVIGVKTTKRKIIIHKITCINLTKISKNKLVEIAFEKDKGKTEITVIATDRIGLLAEILSELKKGQATLTSTNFKIKKTGYVEAIFEIEIANAQKLTTLLERLEKIPSVQSAERN